MSESSVHYSIHQLMGIAGLPRIYIKKHLLEIQKLFATLKSEEDNLRAFAWF